MSNSPPFYIDQMQIMRKVVWCNDTETWVFAKGGDALVNCIVCLLKFSQYYGKWTLCFLTYYSLVLFSFSIKYLGVIC